MSAINDIIDHHNHNHHNDNDNTININRKRKANDHLAESGELSDGEVEKRARIDQLASVTADDSPAASPSTDDASSSSTAAAAATSSTSSIVPIPSSPVISSSTLPRGEARASDRPGDWKCISCNYHNYASRSSCHKCQKIRGDLPPGLASPPPAATGDWVCPGCRYNNYASRSACHRCRGVAPHVSGSSSAASASPNGYSTFVATPSGSTYGAASTAAPVSVTGNGYTTSSVAAVAPPSYGTTSNGYSSYAINGTPAAAAAPQAPQTQPKPGMGGNSYITTDTSSLMNNNNGGAGMMGQAQYQPQPQQQQQQQQHGTQMVATSSPSPIMYSGYGMASPATSHASHPGQHGMTSSASPYGHAAPPPQVSPYDASYAAHAAQAAATAQHAQVYSSVYGMHPMTVAQQQHAVQPSPVVQQQPQYVHQQMYQHHQVQQGQHVMVHAASQYTTYTPYGQPSPIASPIRPAPAAAMFHPHQHAMHVAPLQSMAPPAPSSMAPPQQQHQPMMTHPTQHHGGHQSSPVPPQQSTAAPVVSTPSYGHSGGYGMRPDAGYSTTVVAGGTPSSSGGSSSHHGHHPSLVSSPAPTSSGGGGDRNDRGSHDRSNGHGQFQGDWTCPKCSDLNFASRGACRKCSCLKPLSAGPGVTMRPGDWFCPSCHDHNYATRDTCRKCMTPKPGMGGDSSVSGAAITNNGTAGNNQHVNPHQTGMRGRPGDWICTGCREHNYATRPTCRKCAGAKTDEGVQSFAATGGIIPPPSRGGERPGDWSCPRCSDMNYASRHACRKCNEPRPGGAPPPAAGSYITSTTTGIYRASATGYTSFSPSTSGAGLPRPY